MNKKSRKIAAAVCAVMVAASCLGSVGAAAVDEFFGDIASVEPELKVAEGDVAINETTFPDATFRKYVLDNIDKDGDGVLSQAEMNDVRAINLSGTKEVPGTTADLTGIEHFPNLEHLSCIYNKITNLDLSNNTYLQTLMCQYNELVSLNVSKNTLLNVLQCYDNKLTSLDVSNNTRLEWLFCWNNQLTSLDVSKNTGLTELYCNNNQLTSIDVSKNTALKRFWCNNNPLTAIDVSSNTDLTQLVCRENQLTSLDLSNNTKITSLYCNFNQLTSLDVSKNTALEYLDCGSNNITNLDLSNNTALQTLYCFGNQLTALDVSKNTALKALHCDKNQLSELDISNNTELERLNCSENLITEIDITNNTKLNDITADANVIRNGSYEVVTLSISGFNDDTAIVWNASGNLSDGSTISKYSSLKISININDYINHELYINGEKVLLDDHLNGDGDVFYYPFKSSGDSMTIELREEEWTEERLSNYTVANVGDKVQLYYYNSYLGCITRQINTGNYVKKDRQVCVRVENDHMPENGWIEINGEKVDCEVNNDGQYQIWAYDVPDDSNELKVTICGNVSDPEEPIPSFVERLYENILNRPSDPSKVSHIDNLNNGESACKVAYDFVFSSEFANLPISNEDRVKRMYLTFLNREADPAGLADWTAVLDNGCSIGHIFQGFTQSNEFTEICDEYGITRGTWEPTENRDKSSKLTAFVSRLYTKAMGRDFDVNGLNDHTGSYLENHDLYQLAYNFIFSQEFLDKNLSNEEFVDVMYRTFFDREPDTAGKADWLDRMANQGYTREDVLAGFVGSQECIDLVARFGI